MDLIKDAIKRFNYYKKLGDQTFDQLEETDFFMEPVPGINSIAVIIQHLYGNMMSRWTNLLTEDGEKHWRKRDAEFEAMQCSKKDLLSFWEDGWKCLLDTLNTLSEEDLDKTITIRTEPLKVYDAILRQLAHYPYHVGQIVYLGKWFRAADWKSLSIPRGNSDAYLDEIKKEQSMKSI